MQLTVEKSDGTFEVYLHTKVMGTVATGLSEADSYDPYLVEELAEAVTVFVRRRYTGRVVASDELHSMIEVVLCDTGHPGAALALHEDRICRQVRRSRTEVLHLYHDNDDRDFLSPDEQESVQGFTQPWNKSVVVTDLEGESELPHEVARAVAGAVEEKVLGMCCQTVTSSLVRELVVNELLAMQIAQHALADRPLEKTEAPQPTIELIGSHV